MMDAICPKHANMIGVASCKRCIIEALLAENAELKLALAKAIGVNDGDNMGAERIKFFLDLQAENAELRKAETAAISWIDGVIEILELYRPETNSQIEWKKRMVAEGYKLIQAHCDAAMKEQT